MSFGRRVGWRGGNEKRKVGPFTIGRSSEGESWGVRGESPWRWALSDWLFADQRWMVRSTDRDSRSDHQTKHREKARLSFALSSRGPFLNFPRSCGHPGHPGNAQRGWGKGVVITVPQSRDEFFPSGKALHASDLAGDDLAEAFVCGFAKEKARLPLRATLGAR